ncbi:hypothetical protein GALMADRAFT_592984 [Galerina marginata CBS 339.88]|uniref:Uncharacterized protein n=1 Tax=Galerina marginata (strain CBS 339.88) TaxID=685588 RepID=A0A067SSD1_GALM3|nr:hypothetical protein GALMADRAFT_592984 [Galerina marginata CBS 339.88]
MIMSTLLYIAYLSDLCIHQRRSRRGGTGVLTPVRTLLEPRDQRLVVYRLISSPTSLSTSTSTPTFYSFLASPAWHSSESSSPGIPLAQSGGSHTERQRNTTRHVPLPSEGV